VPDATRAKRRARSSVQDSQAGVARRASASTSEARTPALRNESATVGSQVAIIRSLASGWNWTPQAAPQGLGQHRADGVQRRVVVGRVGEAGEGDDRRVPVELHRLAARAAHVELRARGEQSGLEQAEPLVVVVLEDQDAHVRSMQPRRGGSHSSSGGEP